MLKKWPSDYLIFCLLKKNKNIMITNSDSRTTVRHHVQSSIYYTLCASGGVDGDDMMNDLNWKLLGTSIILGTIQVDFWFSVFMRSLFQQQLLTSEWRRLALSLPQVSSSALTSAQVRPMYWLPFLILLLVIMIIFPDEAVGGGS